MEDSTFGIQEYQMDSFDYQFDGLDFQSLSGSGDSYNSSYNNCLDSKRKRSFPSHNGFPAESPESVVTPSRPTKQIKTNSWNPCPSEQYMPPKASVSSASQLISFENSNSPSVANSQQFYNLDTSLVKPKTETCYSENLDFAALISPGIHDDQNLFKYDKGTNKATTITRNSLQAQDHVMAERKRREKLSQRFIALSAIVPGLKKVPTRGFSPERVL